MIEMTGNTMTAAANLRVDDEIAAFCASHGGNSKAIPHQIPNMVESVENQQPQLISIDNIVPEPSVSDMSLKSSDAATITHHPPPPPSSIKKDKKRCK